MKLDVAKLPFTKLLTLEEDLRFDPEVFVCHSPLINVISCHGELKAQRFEEFVYVTLSIKAKVTLECSYSLTHFESEISGSDELHFAPSNDEDEDCIVYKGTTIDMDQYFFNLLSASIPLSPKAPNAKTPKSGKGYRVLSEEEFFKEREEQGNSQFDALKDIEFDD